MHGIVAKLAFGSKQRASFVEGSHKLCRRPPAGRARVLCYRTDERWHVVNAMSWRMVGNSGPSFLDPALTDAFFLVRTAAHPQRQRQRQLQQQQQQRQQQG